MYLILVYGYILLEFNFLILQQYYATWKIINEIFYIIILKKKNNVKNREFLYVLAASMQFRNSKGYYIFFALATIHKNTKGISSLFYFSAGLLLTQQPYLRILTLFTMAKFTCLYLQICYMTLRIFTTWYIFLHSILLQNCVKK